MNEREVRDAKLEIAWSILKVSVAQLERKEDVHPLASPVVATKICRLVTEILGRPCQGDDDSEHYALEDQIALTSMSMAADVIASEIFKL